MIVTTARGSPPSLRTGALAKRDLQRAPGVRRASRPLADAHHRGARSRSGPGANQESLPLAGHPGRVPLGLRRVTPRGAAAASGECEDGSGAAASDRRDPASGPPTLARPMSSDDGTGSGWKWRNSSAPTAKRLASSERLSLSTICPCLAGGFAAVEAWPGGHHLDRDYGRVARRVFAERGEGSPSRPRRHARWPGNTPSSAPQTRASSRLSSQT